METKEIIDYCTCYAYFGDGRFLGWYSDTFGSITENQPKCYSGIKSNKEIIEKNFKYKIKKINTPSNLGDKIPGLEIIDASLKGDSFVLSQYKEIELRAVKCPVYYGPNPDFDEEKYDRETAAYTVLVKDYLLENGIEWGDGCSSLRSELITKFEEVNKRPNHDNWIYPDYKEVRKWAEQEPTEFLFIIKSN